MFPRQDTIVKVRSAFKRYSQTNVILRGFNMTVEKGTIYGLLGPSGCGKTTLLGCVTGYLSLDSGSISVNVESKKQLGYMPQELALVELFTVSEILKYFGKVNGLSSSEVENRAFEVLRLLNLPAEVYWNRIIGTLSGGEQRRISLTVALLHDPDLLILDEPTVGLDPLINQRLWEFFISITEGKGKSIIVTTHYIEEARQAHKVGLMRNGVLLAEDTPARLLAQHNCEALEDVFLLLSYRQLDDVENYEYPSKVPMKEESVKSDKLWNLTRMEAQIFKNICWAKRNIPILLLITALPALMMLLFNEVYSDQWHGVNIATVSEEVLPDSCLRPSHPPEDIPHCKSESRLSCHYLQLIQDKSYTIVEYPDLDSATEAFSHGRARALLHFGQSYSWSLIRRLSDGFDLETSYINGSMVNAYIDMSDIIIAYDIQKDIRDSFHELMDFVFEDCGYNPEATLELIKFEKPVYGNFSPNFVDTALGGFVIPFSFFMTTLFCSVSIHSEKISGFLERCLTSGVRHTEIMFAHMVTQILLLVGQNFMLISIAYGVYSFPLKGSMSLLIFFITLAEIQGMFYGFFLGTLFTQERGLSYSATGTVVMMYLSCGLVWPVEGAHWAVYMVLQNFPTVMAVKSYQNITLKGWGLSHAYIVKAALANIVLALVFIALYTVVCKAKK